MSEHWSILPHDDPDYLHICDVERFANDLLEACKLAKAHFGSDWGE